MNGLKRNKEMEAANRIKWLKYVVRDDIKNYELLGWAVVEAGGTYSVIMEWMKEGDPVMPDKD